MGKSEVRKIGVVGSIDEDDVHATHASIHGQQGIKGHLVLGKEHLGADEATSNPQQNDDSAEQSCPPAHQECRLHVWPRDQLRSFRVDCHLFVAFATVLRGARRGWPRPSTSVEGRAGRREPFRWRPVLRNKLGGNFLSKDQCNMLVGKEDLVVGAVDCSLATRRPRQWNRCYRDSISSLCCIVDARMVL